MYRKMLAFLLFGWVLTVSHAGTPLWIFEPQTPVTISIAKDSSAQIIYKVTNLSSKTKNLVMKPIAGVTQISPCVLLPKNSCTLTLNVNGSTLRGDVLGGPVLCPQGSDTQCYQPSPASILRIHLTKEPPVKQFTVVPSAGANGSIFPATPQVVNAGSHLTFTATPSTSFGINEWLLDGNVVQNGGATYQLSNIQANHTVQVTFQTTTLTPSTQDLVLSINSPSSDPVLVGNPRVIQIENTGSATATGLQVNSSGFPTGTTITSNTCMGTLNAGATCNITITPGSDASLDGSNNACTVAPGTEPVPTIVTVTADNALATNINVLLLGYGCIYQGGYLFSVDDSTPSTQSIGGKVADLANLAGRFWASVNDNTTAISTTDGAFNTNQLATPLNQYPAAQACLNSNAQGFVDWYLPAICELGRYVGLGTDAGCGTTNSNLYITLNSNGLGDLSGSYWSSTQASISLAWIQDFTSGSQQGFVKRPINQGVRCIRIFTP